MKSKTPLSTTNYKDHFTYDNIPFMNPEDGELDAVEWATVLDTNLAHDRLEPNNRESPLCFLQITASGEIRGVTDDFGHPANYFYVASDYAEILYLKEFAKHYPENIPTLTGLMDYQNYIATRIQEESKEL
jgi:hypothetical protein